MALSGEVRRVCVCVYVLGGKPQESCSRSVRRCSPFLVCLAVRSPAAVLLFWGLMVTPTLCIPGSAVGICKTVDGEMDAGSACAEGEVGRCTVGAAASSLRFRIRHTVAAVAATTMGTEYSPEPFATVQEGSAGRTVQESEGQEWKVREPLSQWHTTTCVCVCVGGEGRGREGSDAEQRLQPNYSCPYARAQQPSRDTHHTQRGKKTTN